MELYPIVYAANLWGQQWVGLRIVVHCDCAHTVSALNKGYSNKEPTATMLRIIMFLSMKHNFFLRAQHVMGKLNIKSDLLSRLQVQKFLRTFPEADRKPTALPQDPLLTYNALFVPCPR